MYQGPYPSHTHTSPGGTLRASVMLDGEPVPLRFRSDGRPFVAGEPGQRVAVRVTNFTTGRLEVLLSLDGRSVLEDKPAVIPDSHGLVLAAGAVYTFKVWRLSDETGLEIVLGSVEDSIAAQATGSDANVGVIGIAAWRERSNPHSSWRLSGPSGQSVSSAEPTKPQLPGWAAASASAGGATMDSYVTESASSTSANTALRSTRQQQVGLGAGDEVADRVGRTSFIRVDGDPDVLVIGYDTAAALDECGIVLYHDPEPFSRSRSGYEKYRPAR
jgi:hypothetical protein